MPAPVPLVASAAAALWLVPAILVGSVIVGGTAFFFLRARFQERIEAGARPPSAPQAGAEVRALFEQIERALREQRLQGETQRQILAQKLDAVRQSVEAQRDELRRRAVGPAGAQAAAPLAAAPAPPAAPPESPAAAPAPPPRPALTFEEISFGPADGPFAEAGPPRPPAGHGGPDPGSTFVEVAFPSAPPGDGQSTPLAGPADAPSAFETWAGPVAAPPTVQVDDLPVAPADEFFGPGDGEPDEDDPAPPDALPPDPAPLAEPGPEGADDLTVISTIDEEMQARLYAEGVTTLDEIACWGRSDARRVGAAVEVPEDTIMNRWVFEAQAAVFDKAR